MFIKYVFIVINILYQFTSNSEPHNVQLINVSLFNYLTICDWIRENNSFLIKEFETIHNLLQYGHL